VKILNVIFLGVKFKMSFSWTYVLGRVFLFNYKKIGTKIKWARPVSVLEAVNSWNERDCGMRRWKCVCRGNCDLVRMVI